MSTTVKQDTDFASQMNDLVTITVDGSALEIAIDYIGKNLNPDDVFSTKDLEGWAESNGYTKE